MDQAAAPQQVQMDQAQTVGKPADPDGGATPPPVPMEMILASLQQQSRLDIIEKAQASEMIMNLIGADFVNIDLPNKYKIKGQSGENLFFAVETTSILQSTIGWNYALDIAYTEGGSAVPLWKLRGDMSETTVANASTDEVEATIWQEDEAWCCCVKSLSRCGCHSYYLRDRCPWWCCCCEVTCECCCCCWNQHTYLMDMNIASGTQQMYKSGDSDLEGGGSGLNRKKSFNVNSDKAEASLAIVDNRSCTCPWILTGCCGEGSDWLILKNPRRDESQKPLIVWQGEEIGTVRRKGKGLLATWCLPSHDVDHWKLDLPGAKEPKEKLAALATVLFMDHANIDQA